MKSMIKFNMRFILCLCMTFLFISSDPNNARAAQKTAKKKNITLGWSNAGARDSWRYFLIANFNAELAKHPEVTKYYYKDANEKPEKQSAQIDELLGLGIDLLIVYPTSADTIVPAIKRAYATGIPVIIFGGKIDSEKYTSLICQDFLEFGRAGAAWLVQKLNGKGNIVLMSGIAGNSTAEDRLAGAREVFKKFPDIKILSHSYTDWSIPKAKTAMENMIKSLPQIDGIWADSGLSSWPALQALKEAGKPLVPSTGDHLNGYAKFLVDNNISGFIYPITTTLSAEALRAGLKAVKGKKIKKQIYLKLGGGIGPDDIKELVRPNLSDFWWIGDDQMDKRFLPKF